MWSDCTSPFHIPSLCAISSCGTAVSSCFFFLSLSIIIVEDALVSVVMRQKLPEQEHWFCSQIVCGFLLLSSLFRCGWRVFVCSAWCTTAWQSQGMYPFSPAESRIKFSKLMDWNGPLVLWCALSCLVNNSPSTLQLKLGIVQNVSFSWSSSYVKMLQYSG